MRRDRIPYILIPVVALIAVLPLILQGCSCGHDFDFHILNWFEAANQFTHGNLHPHWAYTPAWNAGEPRFVFYPPISWIIGAILGLVFPWTWTPIVYTWLALTASGLALHRLARDYAPPTAALLAATFYTLNPYMLFTAYERTAYAELLAAAWIPLLLHAILRKQISIPRIAIPVALLWLTNAPAAVMSCYALALLTLVRLLRKAIHVRKVLTTAPIQNLSAEQFEDRVEDIPLLTATSRTLRPNPAPTPSQRVLRAILPDALKTMAGTILGLGLAAFYIVPAAYQRRYVQIAKAIIPGMRIQDNSLFHHTGEPFHDDVLHTASIIALILLILTAVVLLIAYLRQQTSTSQAVLIEQSTEPAEKTSSRLKCSEVERPLHLANPSTALDRSHPPRSLLPSLAILAIAITLLLTPVTAFLWNHAPELAFLQFPWRLLAILAAVLSLTAALALRPLKLKPIPAAAITIALAVALTYPAYKGFRQSCDEDDTVQAREALFHSNAGTDPTDEYTPTTGDTDSLAHTNPAFWLSPDPNAKAPSNTNPAPAPTQLTLNSPIPQILILNLSEYPAWHVTLNQMLIATREQRDDGLLAISIPAGPSSISITYAQTMDQTIGDILSLLSIGLLLLILVRKPSILRL